MSDGDDFVRDAVEYMVDDLNDDKRYELLTEAQRTVTLLWVLDGRIRGDGLGGWIETHGRRSGDALAALDLVGANEHAAPLRRVLLLLATWDASDPDTRLAGMDAWTVDQATAWRQAEDEYLSLTRRDNLIDNYLRAFVTAHPDDFPTSIYDL